jgi:hypothetical protein
MHLGHPDCPEARARACSGVVDIVRVAEPDESRWDADVERVAGVVAAEGQVGRGRAGDAELICKGAICATV